MHWHKECHRYIYENPHKVINKYSFCSLFAKAWIKTMTSTNIMKAFQTTSVYPLNKDAVKMSMKCSIVNEFADKCVLYIPLYSTAVCQKSQQKRPVSLPSPPLAHSTDIDKFEKKIPRFYTKSHKQESNDSNVTHVYSTRATVAKTPNVGSIVIMVLM